MQQHEPLLHSSAALQFCLQLSWWLTGIKSDYCFVVFPMKKKKRPASFSKCLECTLNIYTTLPPDCLISCKIWWLNGGGCTSWLHRWVHFRCINMGLHKHSCCTGTTVGGPAAVGGSGHGGVFFLIADASYAVTHQELGRKRIADLWVLSGRRGCFYVRLSHLHLSQPTTPTPGNRLPSCRQRRDAHAGTQIHRCHGTIGGLLTCSPALI